MDSNVLRIEFNEDLKGMDEIQIGSLVKMDDPQSVLNEIKTVVYMISPEFDFDPLTRVFNDMIRLFNGKYPGYRACNTEYHDLRHTTDALLAMTRLIHGAARAGESISLENMGFTLIATGLHDTGYIQTVDDVNGTGSKYTPIHIQRSIEFMDTYFRENGFEGKHFEDCKNMLKCTGVYTNIDEITFASSEIELLGKMLGTADLVSQMSDRTYLEKLLFLFYEFREAKILKNEGELDFLKKTIDFYGTVRQRIAGELGGVTKYLPGHFQARFNIDRDLYESAMEKNIHYLKSILKSTENDHRGKLRRGGVLIKLAQMGK